MSTKIIKVTLFRLWSSTLNFLFYHIIWRSSNMAKYFNFPKETGKNHINQ